MVLEVGYWDIRGLGAPLRMICEYAGVEYNAVNYTLTEKEGGGYDASDWFDKKPAYKEKNALMNLPYVVDGDVTVTQSNACMTYLGRKFNLNGQNDQELTKMEQCLCEVFDLRNNIVKFSYSPKETFTPENVKTFFSTNVDKSFDKLNSWLEQQGTKFLAADQPTVADFHFFELIDQMLVLANREEVKQPDPLANYSKLQSYYNDFKQLPAIAKYLESDLHKLPINNKMACFK